MDYEKEYKGLVAKIKNAHLYAQTDSTKNVLENIFPELKKSEEEDIRTFLHHTFTAQYLCKDKLGKWHGKPVVNILAWLEKQGNEKKYTFKAIPRLLEMVEPTSKAKAYCQKLIDALVKEGYATDAKVVGECLKQMNGEKVALATMDEKQGEKKPIAKMPINDELYEHIRNTCACIDDALSSETLADINDYLSMAERSANSAFDIIEKQCEQKSVDDLTPQEAMNIAVAKCFEQGEHKTTNKVEPKFHEGDWIINKSHDICLITDIDLENSYYICESNRFGNTDGDIDLTDKAFHLWTLKDAKDGDVLAGGDWLFIFREFHINGFPKCHCHYDLTLENFKVDTDSYISSGNKIKPATKEQRGLLFEKMKAAGYEWDEDKKKLKKIKQSELTEFEDVVKDMMNAYRDAIGDNDVTTEEVKKHATYLLSLIPHKSAKWSDEDEELLQHCCGAVAAADYYTLEDKEEMGNWLKSLKKRMEEQ